jgi:hypothetical protein
LPVPLALRRVNRPRTYNSTSQLFCLIQSQNYFDQIHERMYILLQFAVKNRDSEVY